MAAQAVPANESIPSEESLREVLTPGARDFLTGLHKEFHQEREELLRRRAEPSEWLSGARDAFSPCSGDWKVAAAPRDLLCRHVEITGPAEPKMMINALNSGADVFMADIEDSLSPSWGNVIMAQRSLYAAARGTLEFRSPEGRVYRQEPKGATLVVRPRGWHLHESHFLVDGRPISASLFDFGLAFFHNARALLDRDSGPYFYLPKLENALEARLWNKVFVFAQDALGLPRGTIRATVLIETITAAFEMDGILFELREHASGLNAGRWDYLFSLIKKLAGAGPLFPDRSLLTMDLPFLRSYCELLVQTCHRRGAHAIGGMSAFIPSRKDAEVNRTAFAKVSADKEREIALGFDGSWVAHPDLVPLVKKIFRERLGGKAEQKQAQPPGSVRPADLLPSALPSTVTEAGIRTNISVTLLYIHRWIGGQGAVAIHNLMEDAATAEISRAQLWQWLRRGAETSEGYRFDEASFRRLLGEELAKVQAGEGFPEARAQSLRGLLERLVTGREMPGFLTIPAYEILLSETDAQAKEPINPRRNPNVEVSS